MPHLRKVRVTDERVQREGSHRNARSGVEDEVLGAANESKVMRDRNAVLRLSPHSYHVYPDFEHELDQELEEDHYGIGPAVRDDVPQSHELSVGLQQQLREGGKQNRVHLRDGALVRVAHPDELLEPELAALELGQAPPPSDRAAEPAVDR